MTKSEFWKNAVPKNVKGQVVTAAVFAYISAAMTLVLGFLTGNFLVLIDVLLVLGLGLGVHLAEPGLCHYPGGLFRAEQGAAMAGR